MSVVGPLAMRPKDPDAIVPFGFDWTARLAELGTTIAVGAANSTFTLTLRSGTATPVLAESSRSQTTTTTQIVLTGGDDGSDWDLTNHIIMANGLVDDRTMVIQVRHR